MKLRKYDGGAYPNAETIRQRHALDVFEAIEDRLAYQLLHRMAHDGHGDIGACGVAHFHLQAFAEALGWPPGKTLRRLKGMAQALGTVCVEYDDAVLFAMRGAVQTAFDDLFQRERFEGAPPAVSRKARAL